MVTIPSVISLMEKNQSKHKRTTFIRNLIPHKTLSNKLRDELKNAKVYCTTAYE